MWEQGPRGNSGTCSTLCRFQSLPLLPPSKLDLSGIFLMWMGLCTPWVSPTTSPVRLGVSLHLNPHRCFQSVPRGSISQRWDPGFQAAPCFTVTASLGLPVATPWLGSASAACAPRVCPMCPVPMLFEQHNPSPPGFPTPPLLPVWMNVSILTPWL
ncbi:hypothetical protein HJG60_010959 [Phyllostomus discolor]|uniref:Uncharacterized protein n=1 Tax=Phyllostomus discolor TaxID=89673 RepID=A0A834AHF8_9CHIR|nr:hypothetical protein HJG60_010959 [Phyllostomus discolor]